MAGQDRLFRTGDFVDTLDDFSLPLPVYFGERMIVLRDRDELRRSIDLFRHDVIGGEKPFISCALEGVKIDGDRRGGAAMIWTLIYPSGQLKAVRMRYCFEPHGGAAKIAIMRFDERKPATTPTIVRSGSST